MVIAAIACISMKAPANTSAMAAVIPKRSMTLPQSWQSQGDGNHPSRRRQQRQQRLNRQQRQLRLNRLNPRHRPLLRLYHLHHRLHYRRQQRLHHRLQQHRHRLCQRQPTVRSPDGSATARGLRTCLINSAIFRLQNERSLMASRKSR